MENNEHLRLEQFVLLLEQKHPVLSDLVKLLGQKFPDFMLRYEGKTLVIPSRLQLENLVREADVKQMVARLGLREALSILTTRHSISVLDVCRILGISSKWYKA
jgi:hypothetical protein